MPNKENLRSSPKPGTQGTQEILAKSSNVKLTLSKPKSLNLEWKVFKESNNWKKFS